MQQRIKSNEDLDSWIKRVHDFELESALRDLTKGKDPNEILEEMSRKLIKKIMHPITLAWLEDQESTYNTEFSRQQYQEYMDLKNLRPKADHVSDE